MAVAVLTNRVPTESPFVDNKSASGVSWPWIRFFQLLHDIIFGTSGVAGSGIITTLVAYVPVVVAQAGVFTTVSSTGRYKQIGKLIFIQIVVTITTNGTASGWVLAALPFKAAAFRYIIVGRAVAISGKELAGDIVGNSSNVAIFNYDSTYPGASGETLVVSGFYEAA